MGASESSQGLSCTGVSLTSPASELSEGCLSKAQDVLPKAHDSACCAPHLSKPTALAISPCENLQGNSVLLLEHK